MKFYFLIIIIYMIAVSCKTNHQEKLIYGKWEMLTVRNNDTIFFEPCNYGNRYIIYD